MKYLLLKLMSIAIIHVIGAFWSSHRNITIDTVSSSFSAEDGDIDVEYPLFRNRLIIGGLFPIHRKSSEKGVACGSLMAGRGLQRAEAMLYAIDRINQNDAILPGIKLVPLILDTCADPVYALNQSLAFVQEIMNNWNQKSLVENGCYREPTRGQARIPPVAAIIGASLSDVTVQTANLLKLFSIVQVSPASTVSGLSDKSKYPFFARTVPADMHQARALADIAQSLGWSYVSLVSSSGDYGHDGATEFRKAAKTLGICIAIDERISNSDEPFEIELLAEKLWHEAFRKSEVAGDHEEEVGAKAVVLFTGNQDTKRLLQAFKRFSTRQKLEQHQKLVWLAADGWETGKETTEGTEEVAVGAIAMRVKSHRISQFETYFNALHPSRWKSTSHAQLMFERAAWLDELWETSFNCTLKKVKSNKTKPRPCDVGKQSLSQLPLKFEDKIEFVIDAVYAVSNALHAMWLELCVGRKRGLCAAMSTSNRTVFGKRFYKRYLMNVNFTGSSDKKLFRFTDDGDGPAEYDILSFNLTSSGQGQYKKIGTWDNGKLNFSSKRIAWPTATHKPPISRCSFECKAGQVKKLQSESETCCWVCVRCLENEFLFDLHTCKACPTGHWPDALLNRTDCYDIAERALQFMEWDSSYSAVPTVFASIGLLLTLFVLCVYVMKGKTAVIRASGRELSSMILVAILMCYLNTFVLLSKPTPITCGAQRICVGLAFAILYSSLLVKTNRIYRIFHGCRQGIPAIRFITPRSQVIITTALASVQLSGSLLWLLLKAPNTQIVYPEPQPQAVLACNADDEWLLLSFAYVLVLIVCCTVYGILTRAVPENFNETKFIAFTMYTTCIIWLAFVPIFLTTRSNFRMQISTICMSISLSATVALACLFGPKLFVVFFEPESSIRKQGTARFATSVVTATSPMRTPTIYTPMATQKCSTASAIILVNTFTELTRFTSSLSLKPSASPQAPRKRSTSELSRAISSDQRDESEHV